MQNAKGRGLVSVLVYLAYLLTVGIGCGTTPSTAQEAPSIPKGERLIDKEGVLDWQGRQEGLPPTPSYLLPLLLGDAREYSIYTKKPEYVKAKWIVVAVRAQDLESAKKLSLEYLPCAISSSIATSILGTIGSTINSTPAIDSKKAPLAGDVRLAIRSLCAKVPTNTLNLKGLEYGGDFYRKVGVGDEASYINLAYDYYSFYYCTKDLYNELMNAYLVAILESPNMEGSMRTLLLNKAQDILNDAYTNLKEHQELVRENTYRELKLLCSTPYNQKEPPLEAKATKEAEDLREDLAAIEDYGPSKALTILVQELIAKEAPTQAPAKAQ